MEEIKQCQICSGKEFSSFLNCRDYFLTKELFTIVKCNSCEFTFVNPRPGKDHLANYYDSPDYISHSGTEKGLINYVYKKVRRYTHKKKYLHVSTRANGREILDIGCASGELLFYFKQQGWKTVGIEPNEMAREFAKKQYNLEVFNESVLDQIPEKSVDVITMWHVLEHVSDLNERLVQVKRILKKDGVVFIAVPNRTSYDAIFYKEFWAAYDVPRHLYHFTPDTLIKLMSKHSFSVTEILPMKFDAYYVSMLSEKYKSGKSNLLKAVYTGLRSNMKAGKSGWSSLIYIIRNAE